MEEIGYAIDFKEIKRVFLQWIDDILDHGMILNPKDELLIKTTKEYGTKLWLMSLAGEGEYCNPSVENITREVYLAMEILVDELYRDSKTGLKIFEIKIFETPNCASTCRSASISDSERLNFYAQNEKAIRAYAVTKGKLEYDDRKK
jgi:6-pyruvoyltetrahydropterin/6-carboxytetrahydropterin synthase